MALSWNTSFTFDNQNKPSRIPNYYLDDFLRAYREHPASSTTPEKLFPGLISQAFRALLEGQSGVHDNVGIGHPRASSSDLFVALTESMNVWLERIHMKTPKDRVHMLDIALQSFSSVHAQVNSWHSDKIVDLGARWIRSTFSDVLDTWLEEVHYPLFLELDWRYYAHLTVLSASFKDMLLPHYQHLWENLAHVDTVHVLSKQSDLSWHNTLEHLLLPMVSNTPEKMLDWIRYLEVDIHKNKDRLSLIQQEHLEWLCQLRDDEGMKMPKYAALQKWLIDHRAELSFLDKYRNIQSLSLKSSLPSVDDVLAYVNDSWMRNQVLSRRIPTSSVVSLMDLSSNAQYKRTILESVIQPIMDTNIPKNIRYQQGLFNNQQHDKSDFYKLCKSKDLGIRVLCVSYMLKQFDSRDYSKTPYPNHIKRDGEIRLFGKTSRMLEQIVPELLPLWDVFADLRGYNPKYDSDYASKQSQFLWDYYQQHFGLESNKLLPLDVEFLAQPEDSSLCTGIVQPML